MEQDAIFTCEKCKEQWKASDYNEDAEGKEGYYAQGLECPNCGETDDISGKAI